MIPSVVFYWCSVWEGLVDSSNSVVCRLVPSVEETSERVVRSSEDTSSCTKTLLEALLLRPREEKTVEQKILHCAFCNKSYQSKRALRRHIQTIHEERYYLCEACGKRFSEESTHKSCKYSDNSRCKICNKLMANPTSLRVHMRTQHQARRFLCETCGKLFPELRRMRHHMRIHTGEKPYSCEECGKKFRFRTAVTSHMTVHTKQRRFVCELCDKNYAQRMGLMMHVLAVHSEERPFACNICPWRFISKGRLKDHLKVHARKAV